jgi:hypothetical protein
MVKQRKDLEEDQRLKRKYAGNTKAALKKIQESKKVEMPAFAKRKYYS